MVWMALLGCLVAALAPTSGTAVIESNTPQRLPAAVMNEVAKGMKAAGIAPPAVVAVIPGGVWGAPKALAAHGFVAFGIETQRYIDAMAGAAVPRALDDVIVEDFLALGYDMSLHAEVVVALDALQHFQGTPRQYIAAITAKQPRFVVFAAATPGDAQHRGQASQGQQEEHCTAYAAVFESFGYFLDLRATIALRDSLLSALSVIGAHLWLPKNILVFEWTAAMSAAELLRRCQTDAAIPSETLNFLLINGSTDPAAFGLQDLPGFLEKGWREYHLLLQFAQERAAVLRHSHRSGSASAASTWQWRETFHSAAASPQPSKPSQSQPPPPQHRRTAAAIHWSKAEAAPLLLRQSLEHHGSSEAEAGSFPAAAAAAAAATPSAVALTPPEAFNAAAAALYAKVRPRLFVFFGAV